ncbi:MAG: HlyD family efflux transporter periplasmic adaptor subunit [Pseudohongiella sp.]|uniref:efflux RND transporter periplasmic adaptor subunit n=1 Tax=Pseudohongiella sp. TaxID=1979412 RepID=UPI0034A03900
MKAQYFPGRTLARFRYLGGKAAGLLIFGIFLMLSMLVIATGPEAAPTERAEREWPVSYREVTPVSMAPTIQVYGKLETDQSATLRAGVTATVAQVLRREGDWVNAGETLVQLDDAEVLLAEQSARAELARAEAALRSIRNDHQLAQDLGLHHEAQSQLAREKLQRFESLHAKSMIADAQLDDVRHEATERAMVLAQHQSRLRDFPNQEQQAEAVVAEASARLGQAELDRQHTDVRAPFSGRVVALDVAAGDRISAGSALLSVADYAGLQVRAPVPVDVAQQLRRNLDRGKPVVAATTIAGERLGFQLRGLAGEVKAGQSGIDAFFHVAPDSVMALGTVVDLTVALPEQSNVVALPIHAVYDNNRVYRITDSRLQAVTIERVGEHMDEAGNFRVLVRSSELGRGDQLLVSQLPTAMTGLLVRPTLAETSQTPALAGQWSSW